MSRPSGSTNIRYVVLLALCLAATISYIQRNSIGVAEKTIRDDLKLTKDETGRAMAAFFFTYALFQLPGGWLSYRWGSRLALTAFTLFSSACTGLTGAAGATLGLTINRLGLGAGQAGLFPACTNTIAIWFPPTRRAFASGALTSFMSVGGVMGAMATGVLLEHMSWRWLFALYALPGVAWSAWFYLWFRDHPEQHWAVSEQELESLRSAGNVSAVARVQPPTPWLELFTSVPLFWICVQQFFRAAAYNFFATWYTTYLQEARDVPLAQAGVLTSTPVWGYVLGSFTGGAISDWILVRTGSRAWSRKGLSLVSQLIAGGLLLAAAATPELWLLVTLVALGAFMAAQAAPCSYAITMDMGGRYTAPVFSLMNMSGNLGAMVLPVVVPRVIAWWGHWDAAIYLLAGLCLTAALCWIPLNTSGTICKE